MYTGFYGLREKPFSLAPDPRYLFLSASIARRSPTFCTESRKARASSR
jgi:hypothetical protein